MVKEAVAIAVEESGAVDEIYVAIIGIESVDKEELFNFVKEILPKYAVPSKIIMLEDFPRTSTGKVKRSEIMKLVS
jgi:long-chain acyl-CoA synthetase